VEKQPSNIKIHQVKPTNSDKSLRVKKAQPSEMLAAQWNRATSPGAQIMQLKAIIATVLPSGKR
jgi:hypothetical protein